MYRSTDRLGIYQCDAGGEVDAHDRRRLIKGYLFIPNRRHFIGFADHAPILRHHQDTRQPGHSAGETIICGVTHSEFEERARRGLRDAMDRLKLGSSAAALARTLQQVVNSGASGYPSGDAVSNWLKPVDDRRHAQIPAWALLAAAEASGTPVDMLVGPMARDALLQQLAELEQRLEALEGRGGAGSVRPTPPSHEESL